MQTQASGFIELSAGSIHYLSSGMGDKLLLAFHGYGNSATIFQPFVRYFEKEFTIISIDLPFHGKSHWKAGALFTRADLNQLVTELLAIYHKKQCSLIGYSMGGRVCLTILELMPANVERCLLIAPDGLVFNPLYYFVTRTFLGKRVFRKFLTEPKRYMNLIEWLRRKEWLDPSRYRFAMYYL
ncbi:MAG: alpha/beta fold hydrolase, partial [Sphingobacteriales bacterium]